MSNRTPRVSIRTDCGSYNFADPREKRWQLHIALYDFGDTVRGVGVTFPEDEEPNVDGLPPSEVVELIAAKLSKLWLNTSRERDNAVVAFIRDNAAWVDRVWATQEIERNQQKIARLSKQNETLTTLYLQENENV